MQVELDGRIFVRISDVAAGLGIHQATLRRWGLNNPEIMRRVSGMWFVDPEKARELFEYRNKFRGVRK